MLGIFLKYRDTTWIDGGLLEIYRITITRLFKEVFGNKVETRLFGNCMAATAFIQGLAVEDIDSKLLDKCDPDYSIVIGIVAVK